MTGSEWRPAPRWRRHAAVVATACAMVWMAPQAAAADESRPLQPVPEIGAPGRLTLSSSAQPLLIPSLSPGQSYSWQVGATLTGETSGRLDLGVVASGSRAAGTDGYAITARGCRQQWKQADGVNTSPTCEDAPGPSTILARTPLSAVSAIPSSPIGELTPAAPWYVSLTLDLPTQTTQRPETGQLAIGVRFTAIGDDGSDLGSGGPGLGGGPVGGGGTIGGGGPGYSGSGPGVIDLGTPYPGSTPAYTGSKGDGVLSWTGAPLSALTVAGVSAVAAGLLLAGIARLRRRSVRRSDSLPVNGASR